MRAVPAVHRGRAPGHGQRAQALRRGRRAVDALLYGFFGSNAGDLAVTRGALSLLRLAGARPPLRVVAPPLRRGQRAGWVGTEVPGVQLHEWDVTLAALRGEAAPTLELVDELLGSPSVAAALRTSAGVEGAEHVFYGGGEHLFSYGDPGHDWDVAGRLLPVLAAAGAGSRIVVLPTTFGPLDGPFAEGVVRRACEAASLVMARDRRSLAFVDAVEGADPALFLETTARARPLFRRAPLRVALVPRLEGVGLRAGADRSREALARVRKEGFEASASFAAFLGVAGELVAAGHDVRVLVQADADRAPAAALATASGAALVDPGSLAQYLRELGRCQAVITARFHSALFALLAGAVPIGLHADVLGHKMPGLFELLGVPELAVGFDAGAALEALARVRADRPGLGAELAQRAAALREATVVAVSAALVP